MNRRALLYLALWEGAALTGAVIPLPGHREHLNRKEPDMVISGLLTHTLSQCKMQSYFHLHVHFPSKTVHTHPQQQYHLKAAWTLLPPNCGALRTPFRQLINVQVTLHCPHGTHFPGPEIIKVTVAGGLPRNPNSPVIPEVFLGLVSLCLS